LTCNIRVDAIETLPEKILAGYCAIVSPEGIPNLYDKLWRAFLFRMSQAGDLADRSYYGVCCNLQANGLFEYWLAVEVDYGDRVPRDLIPFHLEGGTYGCSVESPGVSLPTIYNSLVNNWTAPADYTMDWKMPLFEIFSPDLGRRGPVKICLPLQFSVLNYKDYLSVYLGA
jgi:predicted transcriptional regulator YdeE